VTKKSLRSTTSLGTGIVANSINSVRLDEDELADRWKISVRTLQRARYTKTGILVPWIKIGKSLVRYRLSDVIAYEEANLISPEESYNV
jgi:hypothetical protein